WKTAKDEGKKAKLEGEAKTVAMVEKLMNPIALMEGDSLPVSAFKDCADGQFELGASAYEKRGTAVNVPKWDAAKCIQCNNCAFVCSHATIRPYLVSDAEAKAAPAGLVAVDTKPKPTQY
ncbi:MAG: 4Fe-4S binding protein, partial [Spirochaetaceae bacterium]|nr:4Fe-4S binding protein [Spirochaetaceae bacterium]